MATPTLLSPRRSSAAADAPPRAAEPDPPPSGRGRRWSWVRPELLVLLGLAAVLNLWALSRNGMANDYYAAAVRSMAGSWHDFLYGSFDASGVMTVDKPPAALWIQALSVRVFGFSSWSMLVPQALMGVATVGLVYDLTRRRFGRVAGTVAGAALALTPIAVAISRHNNPDALLVLCSVGALWCFVRALEDGRVRWLLAAGALVGLGFETKMAAALLVVPAMAVAWLWIAPRGRWTAVKQLLGAGGVMAAVGCAWPLLVTLTPAADRPWISGTSDNSVWSLMLGYNGLGRLDGQAGGPQALGGGGGGGVFGGSAGPLRLLNEALGGQAGWLLGFALASAIGIAVLSRLRRGDVRTGWILAVGGAFATIAVAFSFAQGIFHPYYVSLLAPFTAMLVGAGVAAFAEQSLVARVLAPLAVAAGVVVELAVVDSAAGPSWAPPLIVAAGLIAIVTLLVPAVRGRWRVAVLTAFVAALMLAPASWAVQTLDHATSSTFPAGGPASAGGMGGPGGMGGGPGGGRPGGFGGGARGPQGAPPPGGGFGQPGGAPPVGGSGTAGGLGGIGGSGTVGAAGGTAATGGSGTAGAASQAGATSGQRPTGGVFGGNDQSVTAAVAYTQAHGGGTIAVESQSSAASAILASGANVAGIGGFSGRESTVSTAWLADAVRSGSIRWVLTSGTGGGAPSDGRAGSSAAMTVVAKTCTAVPSSALAAASSGATTSSTGSATGSGLYDCSGKAAALAAAA